MKSAKKSLIAIVFAISIISLTVIPSSTVSGQNIVTQMPVARPEGIYMNQIHGNFLGLIRGMQSANFTPDNVYYGVYDSVGAYTYPIAGIRERNISIDIRIGHFRGDSWPYFKVYPSCDCKPIKRCIAHATHKLFHCKSLHRFVTYKYSITFTCGSYKYLNFNLW